MVDHTLLKPEATLESIITVCNEAKDLGTAAVCVNGYWVTTVADRLRGTPVLTCSVVGFPLGAMHAEAVAGEARLAVAQGAQEVDMVLPVGLVKAGEWQRAGTILETVRDATEGVVLKVILEVALLKDEEIVQASKMCRDLGADYVKTSTGFNTAGGATVEAVRLMKDAVGESCGIKASGGIRSVEDVEAMIEAGATRLGLSATVAIAEELRAPTTSG
jgi:deoxyribose-phosphate aldolase